MFFIQVGDRDADQMMVAESETVSPNGYSILLLILAEK